MGNHSKFREYLNYPRNVAIVAQAGFILISIFELMRLEFSSFKPASSFDFLAFSIVYTLFGKGIHILFIAGLLFRWRWFLSFVLTISLFSALYSLFLIFYRPDYTSLLLWLITCIAVILELKRDASKNVAVTGPKKKNPIFVGIGLALLLIVGPTVLVMSSFIIGTSKQGGVAPKNNFESRRRWAERLGGYNQYLKHVENWVRASEMITSDLGKVDAIAPVGSPNYYQGCFTDGCYAAMNLEVVGEKGTGILYLPHIDISNLEPFVLSSIGSEASWTFNGKPDIIDKSGRGLLEVHGVKEKHDRLISLDAEKDSQELINSYEELKQSFELRDGPWQEYYKVPLMLKFAQAFEQLGHSSQAVELYLFVIRSRFEKIQRKWSYAGQSGKINFAEAKEELQQLLRYLRQCHNLTPDNNLLEFYANKRVELWYLAMLGQEERPAYNSRPRVRRIWAEKTLGVFYKEALNWIKHSEIIEAEIGRVKSIYPEELSQNNVYVFENHYGSFMNLKVIGEKGKLSLNLHLKESKRAVLPVELFEDNPRMPGFPLEVVNASWKDTQGIEYNLRYSRKYYDNSSLLAMEMPVLNGKTHGKKKEFFPGGQLKSSVDYLHGEQNGIKRFYFENGKLDLECPVVDGLEEGECRFYNSDGSLKNKINYKQGKPL